MAIDWAVVAAVASVVGVIGGLVSVVFLVYQIRRNAQAIEGATVQSLMSLEVQVFGSALSNADIYLRGCKGMAGLTEVEKLQFSELVGIHMSLSYSAFVQHQQGLIDDDVWQAYLNAVRVRLRTAGFMECWRSRQTGYPHSFQAAMAGVIAADAASADRAG